MVQSDSAVPLLLIEILTVESLPFGGDFPREVTWGMPVL